MKDKLPIIPAILGVQRENDPLIVAILKETEMNLRCVNVRLHGIYATRELAEQALKTCPGYAGITDIGIEEWHMGVPVG